MRQQFQLAQVSCDYLEHAGNPISSLCVRPQCKFKSACCFQCVPQFHENCLKHQKFFKDIPKLIETSGAFESPYQELILTIQGHLSQLIKLLKVLFAPIELYMEAPNLSRLNDLGDLFRKLKPDEQVETSGAIIDKELRKLIDQMRNLLGLTTQVQNITDEQQDQAENWHKESQEQFDKQNYKEAMQLIEKAIKIHPENSQFLLSKDLYLSQSNEPQEEKQEIPLQSEISQNQPNIVLTQSEIFTTKQFEKEEAEEPKLKNNLSSSQQLNQPDREKNKKKIDIAQNILKSSIKLFQHKKRKKSLIHLFQIIQQLITFYLFIQITYLHLIFNFPKQFLLFLIDGQKQWLLQQLPKLPKYFYKIL